MQVLKRSIWLGCVVLAAGCSMNQVTVGMTARVLRDGAIAVQAEPDLVLAEAALPALLKTSEGFLAASPKQPILLAQLAEGYMNYAYGFIEERAFVLDEEEPEAAEVLRMRAQDYYGRARGFALRLLALKHPKLAAQLTAGNMPEASMLDAVGRDALPGLYWVAAPWAAWTKLSMANPQALAWVPVVKAILQRCIALDESFADGGAHMALGSIEAAVPLALGGDGSQARAHFERAIALTQGAFLPAKVLFAQSVGLQAGDRDFFVRKLTAVLEAPATSESRFILANQVARQQAQRLLASVDDLFL